MRRLVGMSIIIAAVSLPPASAEAQKGRIREVLHLEMTLNRQDARVGDKIVARFKITNISNRPITFVKIGALYDAFWFDVREDEHIVRPERRLEKLATGTVLPGDFVALRPKASYTTTIKGAIRPSKDKPGERLLEFWDSLFRLQCGRTYSISGLFWAQEDESEKTRIISGDISSRPQTLIIGPCQ